MKLLVCVGSGRLQVAVEIMRSEREILYGRPPRPYRALMPRVLPGSAAYTRTDV